MTICYVVFFKVYPSLGDQPRSKKSETNVHYVDMQIKEYVEIKVMNANIVINDVRISKRVQN
jgi:hypothetical protein